MSLTQLASQLLSLTNPIQVWMQQAFYPVLLLVLVAASLGVPIPEDVPLIAAGVLLRTHLGESHWIPTVIVALVGVMTGDIILYELGKRWGPDVVSHRSVRWLVTPRRFRQATERFQHHGTWFCFFGRFIMGLRAAMCLTAGATRFPFLRFVVADVLGAIVSVPLFISLGYWFAGMIPRLRAYVSLIQWIVAIAVGLSFLGYFWFKRRRKREAAQRRAAASSTTNPPPAPRGAMRGARTQPATVKPEC